MIVKLKKGDTYVEVDTELNYDEVDTIMKNDEIDDENIEMEDVLSDE